MAVNLIPDRAEILSAYHAEMQLAISARSQADFNRAFHHYERAHILGQKFTWPHVKSHLGMLQIGFLRKDVREMFGQCVRVVAALIFSKIWVPLGNTGGANVSAVKSMPIPEDLKRLLDVMK